MRERRATVVINGSCASCLMIAAMSSTATTFSVSMLTLGLIASVRTPSDTLKNQGGGLLYQKSRNQFCNQICTTMGHLVSCYQLHWSNSHWTRSSTVGCRMDAAELRKRATRRLLNRQTVCFLSFWELQRLTWETRSRSDIFASQRKACRFPWHRC